MDLKLIRSLIEAASEVYPDHPIMQQLTVTQAILESGFLSQSGGSMLARKYNNLFGIKAEGTAGWTPYLNTTEYVNGKPKLVQVRFGANLSYSDSFEQHLKILSLKRYKPVWAAKRPEEAFKRVQECGYATDPKYSALLEGIWRKHVKRYFE